MEHLALQAQALATRAMGSISFTFRTAPFTMFSTFQGRYAEADPLLKRSQAIQEKALGPEHPDVATVLMSRGALLKMQVGTEKQLCCLVSIFVGAVFEICLIHPCLASTNTTSILGLRCDRGRLLAMYTGHGEKDLLRIRVLQIRPHPRASILKPRRSTRGHSPYGRRTWARSTWVWQSFFTTVVCC